MLTDSLQCERSVPDDADVWTKLGEEGAMGTTAAGTAECRKGRRRCDKSISQELYLGAQPMLMLSRER